MRRWIQRKAERAQARDPGGAMDTATRGPSAELPFRGEMERAFNQSFADVKVHTGQKEPMAQLGAHAATEGRTVAFAESQPDKKVVAHELTHVAQNREGGQRGAGVSRAGEEPEREADANAERVVAGGRAEVSAAPASGISRLGESEGELRERLAKLEEARDGVLCGDDFSGMEKLVDQLFQLKQLAHENNFGALANEICGKLPQWTSDLEKIPAEKWPVEERQACQQKLGVVAQAKATYNTLGNDKWRELIDGKDKSYGKECYDKGSNGGGADPGWLHSEQLADRHVGDHIGEHLDLAGYARIHDLALQHGKHHGFRGIGNDIGVPTREKNRDMSAVAEMGPEPTVDIGGKADQDGIYRASHKPMPGPEVQARVQEALDEYYFNIGRAQAKNDRLRVITQVHQKLERLHAFIDGTGRTDHFVLNKFLVENGFAPVILFDQAEVNHSTAATWQAAIETGMSEWLAFANQEAHKQDREQYDAEINLALMQQMMVGTPDASEGRALPQVDADARAREDWRKSHTKVVSSPKAEEEKKTVEERKQPEEKKENPLLALKHGKSELAQKVIDLAIKFGFDSAQDLLMNTWWGDFKEAGVTEGNWDAIKSELV